MHPSISLRSKWRSIAVALVTVGILTVLTAGIALAQGHVANDGQTLEMQSPEVRQLYTSVWGDNATMQWAADHNAAIGQVAPQAQHPRYDDVFHVAYMRSMDMELAGRITADVIARGTIDQFMAGTDMGVLYGYVAPAPQPRAASSSSTSSGPSTPTSPSTSTVSGWGDRNPVYYYEVGQSVSLTLPTAPGATKYTLVEVTDGSLSPIGLSQSSDNRKVSGRLIATTSGVMLTYTAMDKDGTVLDHLGNAYVLTLTIRVRDADLMPFFASEVKSVSITKGDDLGVGAVVLPRAIGGNVGEGGPMYKVTGRPAAFSEMLPTGTDLGSISGGNAAAVGTYSITLTATDADKDTASLTFTITVEKDVEPSVPDIGDMSFTRGEYVEFQLPMGSGGNGTLTYQLAGEMAAGLGLTFVPGTRYVYGTVPVPDDGSVSQLFTLTYTVMDMDTTPGPGTDVTTFTIRVNAAE